MPNVNQHLIEEALDALSVQDMGPIGAEGGQKAVRRVQRNGQDYVLKVISLVSSPPEMLRRASEKWNC